MRTRLSRLALLLALSLCTSAFADGGNGIGILGDSYSDEYQFYVPHRSTARNWVEILGSIRSLNFGEFRAEGGSEPRNQGYAYNWARSAATSDDMIASGQHTGLASQIAAGQIRFAVIFVGGNDFIQALQSKSPKEMLAGRGARAAANIRIAVQALVTASPAVNVLLTTVPDLSDLPEFRDRVQTGLLERAALDQAAAELEILNSDIRKMAVDQKRLAVFDFSRLSRASTLIYPKHVAVAGRKILRDRPGNELDSLFLADSRHLGTFGQGMLAKAIVATMNAKFDARIAPVEDREILAFALKLATPDLSKTVATSPE